MGIDAQMAVALKVDADTSKINERFKNTHASTDVVFPETTNLIVGPAPRHWDLCEYENTWEVNTWLSRYYSIGYERGHALRLMLVLEWLRAQPEVIEVYYGGDCSDSPRVWTEKDSMRIVKHYFQNGNTPYASWARSTWTTPSKEPHA